jgi:alkanesulfonate monooxygenase SsuD/methylene tetrahydromethanopterin reductase-like flavin-dependent oxidoreductase (luciferase family)
MPDYGHDLQFGTFLTPDATAPDRVVELALLTEAAGLELATIQDHPYQSRFLDAWALIATILGRTSTLRMTTNVSNLPLRPPFVLAKTVASLDVLSRGRVELGIGAGAFWDAIVAAGGPRRTPAEAVAALADGIDVIKKTWRSGPAPLHDVEIWIGAIGPRMLALTGRVGDGWLPSESYVPPDTLAERNARIDEPAFAAGRDPVEVRRLYNVTPSSDPAWAEQLAELTLTHGMSTFIVGSDDPTVIQRYGVEVAPAVRALVEVERSRAPHEQEHGHGPGMGLGRRPWSRSAPPRPATPCARPPTTAPASATGRPGTTPPARRTSRRTPRSVGPRRSARAVSTSSTSTTTCARSWPSCST